LVDKEFELREDISSYISDTKHFPINNLTREEEADLKYFESLKDADADRMTQKFFEQRLDAHIDEHLKDCFNLSISEMRERYKQLNLLYMTGYALDDYLYNRYKEIASCYVHGFFNASCILSRAIAESMAKKLIENMGYGHELSGEEHEKKKKNLIKILRHYSLLPTDLINLYSKIIRVADHIIHNRNKMARQEDALNTIECLIEFMQKIPKTT
jgi:ribosomal protein S15P/S13E